MQSTYWNGTYWPTTIQWIGAFLDTLLSASDISFSNALEEYGGNVPDAHTSAASIHAEINKYFSQIEAYYGGEDTIQIFGAAYDDAQWVVLEWLEALKFINQYDAYASSSLGQEDIAKFAHRAHIFYNIVQNEFNTSLCGGGLTWNPALAVYKNAITNELFVASSIGMYMYWPGDDNSDPYPAPNYVNVTNSTLPPLPHLDVHDPLLLQNAIKEYEWFRSQPFQNSQGLIIDGFHISPNQTTCNEPNDMIYTYNQGVILSGLRGLWEATGDTTYLTDGYSYIETVINATGWYAISSYEASQWAGLGRNGIMEDYCDAPATCSQNNQIFKGIYFHHLDMFCQPLPTSKPLIDGLTKTASSSLAAEHAGRCSSYTPWIEHNAHAALATRNASDIIGLWWGAPYDNLTQGSWPSYAVPLPSGSTDEWNNPEVLNMPPWVCQGRYCNPHGRGHSMATLFKSKRSKRQSDSAGQVRNVQTQGAGLGVVKAASDFTLKQPAT
ncbi:MAG: glycoside hydrolase family 76 protein [Acidomyces sp. 'richmondensis']|nr:MAG: glycoside hydrolase family 76 protein [Acidomyces sp. 'richmondensis']